MSAVIRITPERLSWPKPMPDRSVDTCEGPSLVRDTKAAQDHYRADPRENYGSGVGPNGPSEPEAPPGIERAQSFTVVCKSGDWGFKGAPLIVLAPNRLVQAWYNGALLSLTPVRKPPAS